MNLQAWTAQIWNALGGEKQNHRVQFHHSGELPSCLAVTDLAAASIAAAALAIAELIEQQSHRQPAIDIDRRLSAFWFDKSIRPLGWSLVGAWDVIAGDYAARDGWIRLHTNAPHHRAAALRVLPVAAERAAVAQEVLRWKKADLEAAVVAAGGCAAQMLSIEEWAAHPQGCAVAKEPLIFCESTTPAILQAKTSFDSTAPLSGIRVLDLTRVIAGPMASRFLAGYGADVLRIDPPDWEENSIAPEMNPGKRCARLNLKTAADRANFEALLADTDILLHGYRADALERLGYDADALAQLRPGLIDISLNAYGWSGPWRNRRGFDSLVQMSCGIADAGKHWHHADRPVPLPVQALDHATGYLMAAAAIRGLVQRHELQRGCNAKLSLARTAQLLIDFGPPVNGGPFDMETAADLDTGIETTQWGAAQRLKPPVRVEGAPMIWRRPASALGSATADWGVT